VLDPSLELKAALLEDACGRVVALGGDNTSDVLHRLILTVVS
jgi:hypothetical protein